MSPKKSSRSLSMPISATPLCLSLIARSPKALALHTLNAFSPQPSARSSGNLSPQTKHYQLPSSPPSSLKSPQNLQSPFTAHAQQASVKPLLCGPFTSYLPCDQIAHPHLQRLILWLTSSWSTHSNSSSPCHPVGRSSAPGGPPQSRLLCHLCLDLYSDRQA